VIDGVTRGWAGRLALLAVCAVGCAWLAAFPVELSRVPVGEPGSVAARTVKAEVGFRFSDVAATDRARERAASAVAPVFAWNGDQVAHLTGRIHAAFSAARAPGLDAPASVFQASLGVHVPASELAPLVAAGFSSEAEALAVSFVEQILGEPILGERDAVPSGVVTVVRLEGGERHEASIDAARVLTPSAARQRIGLALLERGGVADGGAAAAVARALVRPNLVADPVETEARRARAALNAGAVETQIHPGTTLVREGDVLSDTSAAQLRALAAVASPRVVWSRPIAASLFFLLMFAALYQLAASLGATWRRRDLGVVAMALGVTAATARAGAMLAPMFSSWSGVEAQPSPVLFAAPVAGAAMVVRVLLGTSATLPYALAAGGVAAVAFDGQAWLGPYVSLACVVAAGSIEHTRERMSLFKAGVVSATISAAAAVLAAASTFDRTLAAAAWGTGFAALGGVCSSFFALGAVPLFERLGFLTDYQLLELGSLNHPLLRQLMLRAPGSYHHSIMVGSLAEAACDAIGANGLQARVAAWFHDVGKSVKPQYFVENQRTGNRHDRLDPTASARLIIEHVIEGERLAREHRLPQVIIDNIRMHHGNSQLTYFLARARAAATDPATVREADFRYPGPKPNTREAGVIMLADKVEAATRTLRDPNETQIRAMVQAILNATLSDGQLDDCPLTVQELRQVCEAFVRSLVAVYHQRIEYPSTREISRSERAAADAATPEGAGSRPGTVITLEIPARAAHDEQNDDWESVDHLGGASWSK
jgi:putative nucleotidyltransferase with HDIG domain